jgi:heme exporter protein A
MPRSEPVIIARSLSRRFAYRPVLVDVSFALHRGEAFLLVGPNGAGKTTLLRVLAGLLRQTTGQVERRATVGMVAHDPMLYPALTARENLRFFARLHGVDGARVTDLLEQVGLTHRAHDRVGTFSRGMLQRMAIARALVHQPDVLLFDEPLSGLDDAASRALVTLLVELRDRGTAMILVSHQLELLRGVGTHIVRMAGGRLGPIDPLEGRDPVALFTALMREAG